jgi:glyoxylase-like metal-dependent hydrolase (beta-lactamase superfamily II)
LNLVAALPTTREQIKQVGPSLLDNMYRLVGDAMRGTELRMPEIEVVLTEMKFGSHRLKFWSLKGHTPGDLVILDQKTGVLFTGGVVFNGRAPTTPFADIGDWHQELELIEKIDFKLLVPSHGEVSTDTSAISDTREYLNWLDQTFQHSAAQGLHMMEVMTLRKPKSLKEKWELFEEEYPRTVVHLYPDYERDQLRLIGTPE